MFEAMILLEVIEQDGTLMVTQTDECAYHAEYENRYEEGRGHQVYEVDGAVVAVTKGWGMRPETLSVSVWDKTFEVMIEENETGHVCVPWPVIG